MGMEALAQAIAAGPNTKSVQDYVLDGTILATIQAFSQIDLKPSDHLTGHLIRLCHIINMSTSRGDLFSYLLDGKSYCIRYARTRLITKRRGFRTSAIGGGANY
jgi:hypothetical protein